MEEARSQSSRVHGPQSTVHGLMQPQTLMNTAGYLLVRKPITYFTVDCGPWTVDRRPPPRLL